MADPRQRSDAAPRAEVGRQWMSLTLLALGAGSTLMLLGGDWIRQRLIAPDTGRVRAVREIQTLTSISHLWIEEYVTGDQVDLDEIERHLDRSLQLIGPLAGEAGGEVPGAGAPEPPAADLLLARAVAIREQLVRFAEITRQRRRGYEVGEVVGVGSPIDVRYDAVFNAALADLRSLEDSLERRLERAETRSRLLFWGILLAWVVIVTLAVTGLWTRERRRQRAEAALGERDAQLLQAQKLDAVGRLAGGIAHDINNYLAAITAQCELVRMKVEPDSVVARKMDSVVASAGRSSALIRQLLAFSRRQPMRPEVVNVNETVDGMEKIVARLLGEDVRLERRLAGDLWHVKIDPSQLEQIILNLAINAREAMPTGGSLTLETKNARVARETARGDLPVEAGEYVVLTVRDDGAGIPPEVRDRIFEPFFTTKGAAGNSGLGLATVHGIVEQNGGVIRLESEAGRGTTFHLFLRRSRDGATSPPPPPREEVAGPRRSGRILLAEDNDDLRTSTHEILEALGYSVTTAGSGQEALAVFEGGFGAGSPIDLLVTDVVMPGMSGRELADRLRARQPDLRVLFVSGYTDDVVLRHGIREGEVDFLAKPYSSRGLADKVDQVLAG